MVSQKQFDELVRSCETVLTEHKQRIEALEELLLIQSKPRPKEKQRAAGGVSQGARAAGDD